MAKRLTTLVVVSGSLPPELNSCTELLGDIVSYVKSFGVRVVYCGLRRGDRYLFFREAKDPLEIHCGIEYRFSRVGVIRLIQELILPYLVVCYLIIKAIRFQSEVILTYSPPVTLTPITRYFWRCSKYKSVRCLVLRDDFPRWAKDVGIVTGRSLYSMLNRLSMLSRLSSDLVGCQSILNVETSSGQDLRNKDKYFFLQNWRTPLYLDSNSWHERNGQISQLKPLKIIYAGTMGDSQGLDFFHWLRRAKPSPQYFEFHFVGSISSKITNAVGDLISSKIIFIHKKKSQSELKDFIDTCDAGLLLLDSRHTTNNIPGKYLLYLDAGIPMIAMVNPLNELLAEITSNGIGYDLSKNQCPLALKKWLNGYYCEAPDCKRSRFTRLLQEKYHTKNAVMKILEKAGIETFSK